MTLGRFFLISEVPSTIVSFTVIFSPELWEYITKTVKMFNTTLLTLYFQCVGNVLGFPTTFSQHTPSTSFTTRNMRYFQQHIHMENLYRLNFYFSWEFVKLGKQFESFYQYISNDDLKCKCKISGAKSNQKLIYFSSPISFSTFFLSLPSQIFSKKISAWEMRVITLWLLLFQAKCIKVLQK